MMSRKNAMWLGGSIYIFWGLTPIYWKLLKAVPPFELLAHRIVWGFVCLLPFFASAPQRSAIKALVGSNFKTLVYLIAAAGVIGWNWYNFVLAIVTDRVLESSFAYFLTPLMVVLVGALLLRERLSVRQSASLVLAASGVVFLIYWVGKPPWLALTLSSTFAIYGYFKTKVTTSGTLGVGIENAILAGPACWYLWQRGAHYDVGTWCLLLLSGPLTVIPMVGYARVVRAIEYSTVGFLQYLSPVFQFMLAVFVYREAYGIGHQVAFSMTWVALAIFTLDLWRKAGRKSQDRSAIPCPPQKPAVN
jgi:chloramphenicol-sensitive protein RarD